MNIEFNTNKCVLHQFDSESNSIFKQRIKFIQENLTKMKWKEAVKMSKIWSNIKFKKCRYHPKIYYSIKKFDNSI